MNLERWEMNKRSLLLSLALFVGFSTDACSGTTTEAPAKSAVDRFWEDLEYREKNTADKVVCYPEFNISYEKRGGLLSRANNLLERGGALSLESETSEVWIDKSKIFSNFVVDFSGVMSSENMDKSTRNFTLRGNAEDRRPVLDVTMAPIYNQDTLVGVSAWFNVISDRGSKKSYKERILDLENSYISSSLIKTPAIRGNSFTVEIHDKDVKDKVYVELQCHLK